MAYFTKSNLIHNNVSYTAGQEVKNISEEVAQGLLAEGILTTDEPAVSSEPEEVKEEVPETPEGGETKDEVTTPEDVLSERGTLDEGQAPANPDEVKTDTGASETPEGEFDPSKEL